MRNKILIAPRTLQGKKDLLAELEERAAGMTETAENTAEVQGLKQFISRLRADIEKSSGNGAKNSS